MQNHFSTPASDSVNLELRRCYRHHHDGARRELLCTHGNALGVVARRSANHALFELRRAQVRHLVIGSAQLEAKYGLLVLALQKHGVFEPQTQVFGGLEIGLYGHVVHPCRQNLFEVVSRCQF